LDYKIFPINNIEKLILKDSWLAIPPARFQQKYGLANFTDLECFQWCKNLGQEIIPPFLHLVFLPDGNEPAPFPCGWIYAWGLSFL
jgi:hypothetical protein